jgi:hypothetical protein
MVFVVFFTFAQETLAANSGITYTGQILDSKDAPVTASSVIFTLTIFDSLGKCWLYTEQRKLDLSQTLGTFSFEIGSNDPATLYGAAPVFNNSGSGGPNNLAELFSNKKPFVGLGPDSGCTGTYDPSTASDPNEGRLLSVYFKIGATGTNQALPPMKITPVPVAMQALSVNGYGTGALLKISSVNQATNANSDLTQTQYDEFWRLVKNPLAAYIPSTGNSSINGNLALGANTVPGTVTLTNYGGTPTTSNTLLNVGSSLTSDGGVNNRGATSVLFLDGAMTTSTQGLMAGTQTSTSNGNNITGTQIGTYGYFSHEGTGTVSNAYGGYFIVNNDSTGTITNGTGSISQFINTNVGGNATKGIGGWNNLKNSGTLFKGAGSKNLAENYGTISDALIGAWIGAHNYATSGTVPKAWGEDVVISNFSTGNITTAVVIGAQLGNSSTGTITNAYGISIGGPSDNWSNTGGGTVTNSYGLYIDPSINVGATKYSIYSASTANSYFAGNVGIGSSTPGAPFEITAVQGSSADRGQRINYYSGATGAGAVLRFFTFRGTPTSALPVVNGHIIGSFDFQGYDGTASQQGAVIHGMADGAISSGVVPMSLTFNTGSSSGNIAERMRINSSGNIGIGNTAPATLLHVGGASVGSGLAVAKFQNADGTCTLTPAAAGSGIACSSDARLKENFTDVQGSFALDRILKLQAVTYNFKTDPSEKRHTGYLAQEIQKVAPEFVRQNEDGFLQVYYDGLIPWITEAIKTLDKHIAELKTKDSVKDREIASLKAENAEIKARLERIEKRIQSK